MVTWENVRWEDVEEGQELPELEFPLTFTSMVIDASGTRDIYAIHHDRAFAKQVGARDVFINTLFYQAILGRFVTDWGGRDSFLRKLSFDMRAYNCPGDIMTIRGRVARKYQQDDQKLVELDIHIDKQLGPETTTAQITLELI